MLDGILLVKGLVIDDGGGVADPAMHRLQGLLLSSVAGDDDNGMAFQPVQVAIHDVERGWGHQQRLIHHHHVKAVQREVDIDRLAHLHRDPEGGVQGVALQVGAEDGAVALGQQGHRCQQQHLSLVLEGLVDGSYENLGLAHAGLSQQHAVLAPGRISPGGGVARLGSLVHKGLSPGQAVNDVLVHGPL